MACGAHPPVERAAVPFAPHRGGAADAHKYPTCRPGPERYLEVRSRRAQCFGRWIECDLRDSFDLIETFVAEHNAVIALKLSAGFAACAAPLAPHLEQIRKVRRKAVRQG